MSAFASVDRVRNGETALAQSLPVKRAPSGVPRGTTARTARATSSGKRMRPSSEPPQASLRVLEIGEKKPCSI